MNKKKSIKSVLFLWLGSLLGSGSTFVIYWILARKLGPETFGVFSSALATITVFSLISGFGVSQVWLKLFGEEGWRAIRWLKPSMYFVLLTLGLVSVLLFAWAFFGPHDVITKQLLLLMLFFMIGLITVNLVSSKLQLEERYSFLAFWQLLPNLSRLVIIATSYYVLNITLAILDIGVVYATVGIIATVFGFFELYKMYNGKFQLKGHKTNQGQTFNIPKIRDIFAEAWPFGLGSFFAFIYVQSDIIMLKYLVGDEQVGFYNVSFVVLTSIYLFPSILYQKYLMPKFHRWANFDREKFYSVYKKGNIAMLVLGVIIMSLVLLLSKFFIPLFFGEEYTESIVLINILALTLPFYLVAFSVASALVTKNHMKKKVIYMGVVAVLNLLLNFYLIPVYQGKGAAIATVISNAVLVVIYFYATNKYVFFDKKRINNEFR